MISKIVSIAILPVLLFGCTAPDDPSTEDTVSERAEYSVDVHLTFKAPTTTSTLSESEFRPFHSSTGWIYFNEDGSIARLLADEDTHSNDKRNLTVQFTPPFSQPGTATADDFDSLATGATGNKFKLSLGSGDFRITNNLSYCSLVKCLVSGAGSVTMKKVNPFVINFNEVILVHEGAYPVFETLIVNGTGRWEQTYGAPVTIFGDGLVDGKVIVRTVREGVIQLPAGWDEAGFSDVVVSDPTLLEVLRGLDTFRVRQLKGFPFQPEELQTKQRRTFFIYHHRRLADRDMVTQRLDRVAAVDNAFLDVSVGLNWSERTVDPW